MTGTGLGDGHLSVAGVAVEYAGKIFEKFSDKTVLIIGAGEIASLVLKHFSDLKPGRLIVCNRDIEKGQALAAEWHGEHIVFDHLDDGAGTGRHRHQLHRRAARDYQARADGRGA